MGPELGISGTEGSSGPAPDAGTSAPAEPDICQDGEDLDAAYLARYLALAAAIFSSRSYYTLGGFSGLLLAPVYSS